MSFKAPRCHCGCGSITGGGLYIAGHNSKTERHWSKMGTASRKEAMHGVMKKRRAHAYKLLDAGDTDHDYTAEYFALYRVVKEWAPDADLEHIVETESGYRGIDCAVPSLKLAFEYAPGHHRSAGTQNMKRHRELLDLGWKIIYCKTPPESAAVWRVLAKRRAELDPQNVALNQITKTSDS